MKTLSALLLAGTVVAGMAFSAPAQAYTYVGSWQVDEGPDWSNMPPAFSGQEAAAYLFGGSPSDYVISTVDANAADINFSTWVTTWGGGCGDFPCGTLVAQDYVVSATGFYVSPGDTSAYAADWSIGPEFTNYAFLVADPTPMPEPATMALFGTGLLGLGLVRRRRA